MAVIPCNNAGGEGGLEVCFELKPVIKKASHIYSATAT